MPSLLSYMEKPEIRYPLNGGIVGIVSGLGLLATVRHMVGSGPDGPTPQPEASGLRYIWLELMMPVREARATNNYQSTENLLYYTI